MNQTEKVYQEIYSTYRVSTPPLIYNFITFNWLHLRTIKRMKKNGIIFGDNFTIAGIPYINFISRCDYSLDRNNFYNRIKFGNNNTLFSISQHYPLPNDIVRISILKIASNKIGQLIVGDNVCLAGTSIISYNKVEIENNVLLGPMVTIMDCDGHTTKNRNHPTELERIKTAPILIKEGAWIGQGATILKGVTIGKNSVVGINSVVHKSVPDNTVVAGNPAKIIKNI